MQASARQLVDRPDPAAEGLPGADQHRSRCLEISVPKLDLSALTVGGIAPSYVSVEHAALLMDCSHWTVRRWITSGALNARKMPSGGLRIAA